LTAILGDVLGVAGVAEHPVRDPVDERLVPADERLVGLRVAPDRMGGQPCIDPRVRVVA